MKPSLLEYAINNGRQDLVDEWNAEKNGDLTIDQISCGTPRKVWWRCEKGHEWEAAVFSRVEGRGCPYCGRRKILAGYNDLATTNPEVASSWHPTKNGDMMPSDVMAGSTSKYWWICDKGHEWQASISSRSRGNGCPVCAGKKLLPGFNDLATVYPETVKMWHPTKNGKRTPYNTLAGTHGKAWWICELGHEWEARIIHICRGAGCPICDGKQVLVGFNDLKSQDPEVAAEWHPTLNGDVTPEMVTRSSNKRAWWICELGHTWEAYINSRTGKARPGCPYCTGRKALPGFNDLKTLEPKIADQWHPELNGELTPEQVTCGSNKKAWWVCGEGHVWNAVINSRAGIQKCGCPVCTGNMNKKKLEIYKRMEEETRFKLLGEKRLAELKAKQLAELKAKQKKEQNES